MTHVDIGLLIIRLAIGSFFFASGWRKTFDREVHDHIAAYMARLGVGNPVMNWLIPLAELFGGLALMLGFLTPLASLGLCVVMLGAIYLTCWPKVCDKHPNGPMQWWTALCMEPEIPMLTIIITLAITGAGSISFDHLLLTYLKA